MSVLCCLQEERFSKTSPGMFHLSYISWPMSCGACQLVHVPWKHLRSSSPSMLFIGSGVLCLSLLLFLLLLFWFIFLLYFFICHDLPGSRSMMNLFCWHSNIFLFFFIISVIEIIHCCLFRISFLLLFDWSGVCQCQFAITSFKSSLHFLPQDVLLFSELSDSWRVVVVN